MHIGRMGLWAAAVVVVMMPRPAAAQDRPEQGSKVADELVACRAITDGAARLACFDRTASVFAAAREKREIVVLDRPQMRKALRTVFGFTLPKVRLFGGSDDDASEPRLTEIESEVQNVQETGYGMWVLRLKDGTSWQTTEAKLGYDPRPGAAIKIRAGGLGSYTASVAGQRPVKVKRIR